MDKKEKGLPIWETEEKYSDARIEHEIIIQQDVAIRVYIIEGSEIVSKDGKGGYSDPYLFLKLGR